MNEGAGFLFIFTLPLDFVFGLYYNCIISNKEIQMKGKTKVTLLTRVIQVRVTEEELWATTEKARQADMTLSAYARKKLMGAK